VLAEELRAYFQGTLRRFSVPLDLHGTPFQLRVWGALLNIPWGETRTYTQQTALLGNRLAIRAVASANGKNPVAIVVPCHRVLGIDGSLTGYAGGLHRKRALLQLERSMPPDQPELF
jgi:O-6-methylguanine DNA methyltransferase